MRARVFPHTIVFLKSMCWRDTLCYRLFIAQRRENHPTADGASICVPAVSSSAPLLNDQSKHSQGHPIFCGCISDLGARFLGEEPQGHE